MIPKKFFVFSLFIVALNAADFPTDPVKQRMFDTLNIYIDTLNALLFNVNGNIQSRFDNNVATLWTYWRSAQIFANIYGFAVAGDNRTELTDCLSSFDELINKVITHLNLEVMKQIFDIKRSNTKIEDDLSSQFDEIKDAIFRANNISCLQKLPFNDYYLALAYQNYRNHIQTGLNEVLWRTGGDHASRFTFDFGIALRNLINLRSAIMTARTRSDLNAFIVNYCKPAIFAKFEKVIDTSTDVIVGCSKQILDILNESIEKLPAQNPFLSKINTCV
ncbi:hypothetical protein PVAND_008848 [Polypedilum vanderplanki]|uniref:Secreted protein n=1 Tax=Polypedilum vanderplanki TaxID=319348 RepID=A0A9J6CAX2_POLVA|nr:hypothetical protein PVAND_008848 [Polypedilum vanderplanki]